MSMFQNQRPALQSENGYEEIAVGTASWATLTAANRLGKSSALVCNTSTTESIYYRITGSATGGTVGIVIKPEETVWLSESEWLSQIEFKAASGSITIAVQYFIMPSY